MTESVQHGPERCAKCRQFLTYRLPVPVGVGKELLR